MDHWTYIQSVLKRYFSICLGQFPKLASNHTSGLQKCHNGCTFPTSKLRHSVCGLDSVHWHIEKSVCVILTSNMQTYPCYSLSSFTLPSPLSMELLPPRHLFFSGKLSITFEKLKEKIDLSVTDGVRGTDYQAIFLPASQEISEQVATQCLLHWRWLVSLPYTLSLPTKPHFYHKPANVISSAVILMVPLIRTYTKASGR